MAADDIFCHNCHSKDLRMYLNKTADGRPLFKCYNCNNTFTYGINGGIYKKQLEIRQKKRKKHEPNYIIIDEVS